MSWVGGNKRRPKADPSPELRAFRRRKRRRRLKQGAAWSVLVVLIGAAVGGGLAGGEAAWNWVRTDTDWTRVRTVNARSTHWIPEWEVVELCGVVPGEDLIGLDLGAVEKRLEQHPRISGATVTRHWWDRSIHIKVKEEKPLAVILDGSLQEMALGGLALGAKPEEPWRGGPARGPELPLLTGKPCTHVPAGTCIDHPGIRRALAFLALLDAYNLPGHEWISEISVSDPDCLVAYLLEGGTPIRLGRGRISRTKMRAFFAVLEDLKAEGVRPASIDMRFANQIVVQDS